MSLTSNIKHSLKSTVAIGSFTANDPGMDYLDNGYYNIYRKAYGAYVGSLSDERVRQALNGMRFQQAAFFEPR